MESFSSSLYTNKRSRLCGLQARQETRCKLEKDYKILRTLQFTFMYTTFISVLRYFSLHYALLKCPLTVSKVSVVRLREVSAFYNGVRYLRDSWLYKALNEKILVFWKSRLFFLISLWALKQNTQLQSNSVNIETEWAIESVLINGVEFRENERASFPGEKANCPL